MKILAALAFLWLSGMQGVSVQSFSTCTADPDETFVTFIALEFDPVCPFFEGSGRRMLEDGRRLYGYCEDPDFDTLSLSEIYNQERYLMESYQAQASVTCDVCRRRAIDVQLVSPDYLAGDSRRLNMDEDVLLKDFLKEFLPEHERRRLSAEILSFVFKVTIAQTGDCEAAFDQVDSVEDYDPSDFGGFYSDCNGDFITFTAGSQEAQCCCVTGGESSDRRRGLSDAGLMTEVDAAAAYDFVTDMKYPIRRVKELSQVRGECDGVVENFSVSIFIETENPPQDSSERDVFASAYIQEFNDLVEKSCGRVIIEDLTTITAINPPTGSPPGRKRKLRRGVTATASGQCSGDGCSSRIPVTVRRRPRRRLEQASEAKPPPLPTRKAGHRRVLAQEKRHDITQEKRHDITQEKRHDITQETSPASEISASRSRPRELQFLVDGQCLCPIGAGSDPSFEPPSEDEFLAALNVALDEVGLGPVESITETSDSDLLGASDTETVFVPAIVNSAICGNSEVLGEVADLFQETYDFLAFLTCDPLNRQIFAISFTCEEATCTGADESLVFFEVTVEGFGTLPEEDPLFGEVDSSTRKLEFLPGTCSSEAPGAVAPCRDAFLTDFAANVEASSLTVSVVPLLEPQCQCESTTFGEEGVGVLPVDMGPCKDRRKLTNDAPTVSTKTEPVKRGRKLTKNDPTESTKNEPIKRGSLVRGLGKGKGYEAESTCGLVGCTSGKGGSRKLGRVHQDSRELRHGKMNSSGLRCF
jgi:hypothetical protein